MIKSFCINLKHQKERWNKANNQFSLQNIEVEQIEAVYGNELNIEKFSINDRTKFLLNNISERSSHDEINTIGAIGCYLSHVKCWKNIVENNFPCAIIFEDDLIFQDNFQYKFNNYMSNLPNDIDLFSFGYQNLRNSCSFSPLDENRENFLKCTKFWGTTAYYITNKCCKILLENAFPIKMHVDAFISSMYNCNKINLLFSKESLVIQDPDEGTNIQLHYCTKCEDENVVGFVTKESKETKNVYFIIIFVIICIMILIPFWLNLIYKLDNKIL